MMALMYWAKTSSKEESRLQSMITAKLSEPDEEDILYLLPAQC